VLDAPTPTATDDPGLRQERHLRRASGAYRADDERRPRPAAFAVTRARRSARSQATTAARTPRSRVGTGLAQAKPVRRLRLSDRRHARRPAPATTQAAEQHVGHRPPRTHRQCPPAGVPRPRPVRTRVSQPILDASAKDVPCPSQFAGSATAFTGPPLRGHSGTLAQASHLSPCSRRTPLARCQSGARRVTDASNVRRTG
jgi:hypothetical protein